MWGQSFIVGVVTRLWVAQLKKCGLIPGGFFLGHQADLQLVISLRMRSYMSIPPYAFMVCLGTTSNVQHLIFNRNMYKFIV